MGKKTNIEQSSIRNAFARNSGQAIVEYILLLTIIISLAGALMFAVKGTRDKIWKRMICDVSAACPGCKATDSAKAILPKAGSCPQ